MYVYKSLLREKKTNYFRTKQTSIQFNLINKIPVHTSYQK